MEMSVLHKKLMVTAVGVLPLLMSGQLSAQNSGVLEEVIVTAQKREQNILEIPFAVSVVGEDEIKARGALDIKDLQYSIPGLSISSNFPGQDRVQIRGASSDVGIGSPTVGRYLDEVSVNSDATQRALDIPLLDIQRVEVLRGPQGTLYGAGSIGGTMRFITNSPDLSETSGELGFGFNSVDGGGNGSEISGVFNVPIVEDELAMRIVASTENIAGWIDNTATGESDVNEADRTFVRTKFLYQPSETFNASFLWMNYDFEQDNNNHELSESGFDLLNVDDRGATSARSSSTPFGTPLTDEWDLANLVLNFETENANIISSTGYLNREINFLSETVNAYFPPGLYGSVEVADRKAEVFTQEIRMNSTWDGPLNYTIGAFYRSTDTAETQTISYPAVFPFPPTVTQGTSPVDSTSHALFGEVSYDISERLTATVGLRYFEEDQEPSVFLLGGDAPLDISPPDQSFDALTPRINLLWRLSDSASVYATFAKGFRSGGINGFGSSIPSFDPEEALLFEVGGRGEFYDGRVYLDGAVFYMDYDDVQVAIVEEGRARTTNVESASGPGVELVAGINLTDDLSLNLTAGYVDREYDKVDLTVPSNVIKGDKSQYTPDFTASASLAYDFNWSADLKGMARLDLSHADGFSVYLRTFPPQPVLTTDALTYLNFRIGATAENWQVVLSADNLLDEKDQVFPGGAFALDTYSRPRTLAIRVGYNF